MKGQAGGEKKSKSCCELQLVWKRWWSWNQNQ